MRECPCTFDFTAHRRCRDCPARDPQEAEFRPAPPLHRGPDEHAEYAAELRQQRRAEWERNPNEEYHDRYRGVEKLL